MGLVVGFTNRLLENPEFRIIRMVNLEQGDTELWLGLREPVQLTGRLRETGGVSDVSPTRGRDLSPDSEDTPLTVRLKKEKPATESYQPVVCVYCKAPLRAKATPVCPRCGKSQA